MQTTLGSHPLPPWRNSPAPQLGSPGADEHSHRPAADADDHFVAMLGAYRRSGGLARADEVVTLLESCGRPGVTTLARWIVARSVISFEWQLQAWLPWFQFRPGDDGPEPALPAVVAELSAVYDGWELATWFVQPNPALAGGVPIDRIDGDPDAVLQAARADRYTVTG